MRPTLQRRQQVLQAIVEDYVSSREPVGSKALIERHHLKVSSATIRNDMAALEEEGMITAPHSSAGRVPTEKGYRYFVDEITAPRPLSVAEKRAIHHLLDSSASVEEMYTRTVKILSRLTHQVAILQYPTVSLTTVRHIELIPLSNHQISVIVISDSGRVLQKTAAVSAYTDQDLAEVRTELLREFMDEPIKDLDRGQGFSQGQESGTEKELKEQILETFTLFARNEESSRLLIAGTSYLAQSTEDFSSSIAPILDALEEQVTMLHLLDEMADNARGFSVRIGTENETVPLTETSIVASVYGRQDLSQLGVIGPTRMDYLSATSAVQGVARYLSKILGSW